MTKPSPGSRPRALPWRNLIKRQSHGLRLSDLALQFRGPLSKFTVFLLDPFTVCFHHRPFRRDSFRHGFFNDEVW